jgi:cell division protein FtsW
MRQRFDHLLLGATVLQTAVGLAILASASWLIATERYRRPGSYFLTWQAATAMIGLVLLVVAMHLRLQLLSERRLVLAGIGLCWLALVAAMFQGPVANTHRWLNLGIISVQPSVLARLAVIVFAAIELDRARSQGWPMRRLALLALVGVVTAGLVGIEPDLGSAALIVVVLTAMAIAAGMPLRQLVAPALVGAVVLAVAILSSPYRRERVIAFLDPGAAAAAAWQGQQSLIAIGSGGVAGKGYGAGLQKLFFLPEPHTDFIFAITGEELGFIGLVGIVALVATITWRGVRVAMAQVEPQRALLAFGLIFAFALQSLVHMSVCLDLLPPKGIPLPLISYGKTDLVVTLLSIGLLLNLSREVRA